MMKNPSSTTAVLPSSPAVADAANREIAIFWDFENVQLPAWAKAAEASKAIVNVASQYGRIVDRRLYFDFSGATGNVFSALDSSGFDLVNTPRRNQKETLDKKVIADIFAFAWDSAVRNDNCKPCVVLLTSDGDYAYTLSKLRDRGVMSIVFHGNDSSVASVLRASADIPMSFENDVLKNGAVNHSTPTSGSVDKGPSSLKRNTGLTPAALVSSPTSSEYRTTSDARALCRAVSKAVSDGDSNNETGWLLACKVGLGFREAIKANSSTNAQEVKDRYRQARAFAIQNGWLLQGRRCLTGNDKGQIVIAPSDGTENDRSLYSLEDFLRVTFQGRIELESPERSPSGKRTSQLKRASCALFFKNIPRGVPIRDLVQYLEQDHGTTVRCGNTEKGAAMTPYCFARIETTNPQDAEKLISLAKASKLQMAGRILQVSYDTNSSPYRGDPAFYYERDVSVSRNPEYDDVFFLCKIMYELEKSFTADRRSDWIEGGGIALKFRDTVKRYTGRLPDGDQFRTARASAIARKLIETGRRVKSATEPERIEVATKTATSSRYSAELYSRLTNKGRQLVSSGTNRNGSNNAGPSTAKEGPQGSKNVLIKDLPTSTPVQGVVDYVENLLDCTIRLASIDTENNASDSCSAHVEFAWASDASRLLNLASASDGLVFEGNALVAIPDSARPSGGDDPRLFYKDPRRDSIPSTVSTTSHSIDSSSALSTPEIGVDTQHDVTMFCAVIYEMASRFSVKNSWQAAGSVGEFFQNNLRSTVGSKERFRTARDEVISQGLVEMGRRRLDCEQTTIVLAPYFSRPREMHKKLSSETYFRLTDKGVDVVVAAPELEKFEVPVFPPSKTVPTSTIFFSNLPLDTDINDLVDYLEGTCGSSILRAYLVKKHHSAMTSSAHIEFDSIADAEKVMDSNCNSDGGAFGFVYGGRPLRPSYDSRIPDWNECDSQFLYTNENLVAHDKNSYDVAAENKEVSIDSGGSKPTENCTKKADTFHTTNLLFGDNLAMLYTYGLTEFPGVNETARKKNSPLKQALAVTPSPECVKHQEDTPVEIPDLLWD